MEQIKKVLGGFIILLFVSGIGVVTYLHSSSTALTTHHGADNDRESMSSTSLSRVLKPGDKAIDDFSSKGKKQRVVTLNPDLFEGDIKPSWHAIVVAYGEDVANKLVEEGKLEKPELTTKGSGSDGFYPEYMWVHDGKKFGAWRIRVWIDRSQYNNWQVRKIKKHIKRIQYLKVVKFAFPRNKPTNGKPFIRVGKYGGCWSYIGYIKNEAKSSYGQELSIDNGCVYAGVIEHEMMHALGFYHEQSRPDRDSFVTILWDNIDDDAKGQFYKEEQWIDSRGVEYDYSSVMHYGAYAWSKNGNPTIDAKGNAIGTYVVSPKDKLQIKLMYQCNDGPRSLSDYQANPCTANCKCGRNWTGCGTEDSFCKGSDVCRDNTCVKR